MHQQHATVPWMKSKLAQEACRVVCKQAACVQDTRPPAAAQIDGCLDWVSWLIWVVNCIEAPHHVVLVILALPFKGSYFTPITYNASPGIEVLHVTEASIEYEVSSKVRRRALQFKCLSATHTNALLQELHTAEFCL